MDKNNLSLFQPVFSHHGESNFAYIGGGGMIFFVIVLAITFILHGKISGILVGALMLYLSYRAIRRFIIRVEWYADCIKVIRPFRNNSKLDYSAVQRIYYNKEGFFPTYVFIVEYKKMEKTKKITFYCSKKEYERLNTWLIEKQAIPSHIIGLYGEQP